MAATAPAALEAVKQAERRYWDAALEGDSETMKRMTSSRFTFVMPAGVNEFGRDDFVRMMTQGDFRLTSYDYDSGAATARALGEDAALMAYRVRWTYERAGKAEETDTYYTSIWVREGGEWRYGAAVETPLPPGD